MKRTSDREPGVQSDDALVRRHLAGCPSAFAVLVVRHRMRLRHQALRLLGDAALADDALQGTWLRLWRVLGTYEARGNLAAYLRRMCLNVCREIARAERRRSATLKRACESTPAPGGGDSPLDGMETAAVAGQVRAAVGRLPQGLQAVLALRYEQDLSYDEIAARLATAAPTLRSRVFHAQRRLRAELSGGDERRSPAVLTGRARG